MHRRPDLPARQRARVGAPLAADREGIADASSREVGDRTGVARAREDSHRGAGDGGWQEANHVGEGKRIRWEEEIRG